MVEEIEISSLPLEDKCTHKLWKIRISGYEECITLLNTTPENQSAEFEKFEKYLRIFCSDPNAISLDKALETVLTFIRRCHVSSRTVAELAQEIISKSLAAPKKATKEKAASILLHCCKVGHTEPVQEELLKGLNHKNPRVVSECGRTLSSIIRDIGHQDVNENMIIKGVSPLFDHRDKQVRLEAKNVIIEIYGCVGEAALLPKLVSLKSSVLHDLEGEFKKLTIEKKITPSMTNEQPRAELKCNDVKLTEEIAPVAEDIESAVLHEEVNILKKLPADYYEKIEAKKWQDRKESLEKLLPLSKHTKLASGDYYDLVMSLTQVIGKDTNVLLVTLAGNCLTGIARGLGKQFASYACASLKTILSKFKERKQNVLISLREAADAIYRSTNIDSIRETVVPFLSDKNPSVKQETASFIARCFCYCLPKMLNRKVLKFYTSQLLKMLKESDPNVRDSAAEALGVALKVVGETLMVPLLDGVEPLKLQKIREYSEKAHIKVRLGKPKITKEHQTDADLSRIGTQTTENKATLTNIDRLTDNKERQPTENVQSACFSKVFVRNEPSHKIPCSSNRMDKAVTISKKATSGPLLQTNTTKDIRIKDEQRHKTCSWEFTVDREDLVAQLKNQMQNAEVHESLISNMFHSDFKLHIKCIDELQKDLIKNVDGCIANLDLILQWLTIRFSEANTSVILQSMIYLTQVITRVSHRNYILLDFEAQSFVPFLVLKLGDSNDSIRESANNLLSLLCNIYPSSKISPFILNGMQSENSLQRVVCIEFFGSLFERIGILVCQPNPSFALNELAALISNTDDAVRIAALDVLAKVSVKEKDLFYKYIGKLPDRDMSLLVNRINGVTDTTAIVYSPSTPQRDITQTGINTEITDCKLNIAAADVPASTKILSPLEDTETFKSKFKEDYAYLEKLLENDHSKKNYEGPVIAKENSSVADIANENSEQKRATVLESLSEVPAVLPNTEKSHLRDQHETRSHELDTRENYNEHIDFIISQIAHPDFKIMSDAITKLDDLIRLKNFDATSPRVDLLLTSISQRYEASLDSVETDDCIEIFRRLTIFLLKILQEKALATVATRRSLYRIGRAILTIIVYSRLCQLEGGIEVIRELNLSVILMIQNADFTQIFSALLKLLHNAVETDLTGEFTVVAMKCTWKAIRALPSRTAELDVSQILGDLNEFMIAFPVYTWRDKSTNKPLKTIKTVLHTIIEAYGNEALVHLHKLPNYTGSEIEKYIIKSINKSAELKTEVHVPILSKDTEVKRPLHDKKIDEMNQMQRSHLKEILEKDISTQQKENVPTSKRVSDIL